jgi:hypothetical protein
MLYKKVFNCKNLPQNLCSNYSNSAGILKFLQVHNLANKWVFFASFDNLSEPRNISKGAL